MKNLKVRQKMLIILFLVTLLMILMITLSILNSKVMSDIATQEIQKGVTLQELKLCLDNTMDTNITNTLIISLVLYSVIIFAGIMVSYSFTQAIGMLTKEIAVLGKRNFSIPLNSELLTRKDDFGILANVVESMRSDQQKIVGMVKEGSIQLYNIVDSIKNAVDGLNENVNEVSAATQECAAGMQETAAASEEIMATAEKMNSSAQDISKRAEEGSRKVITIRNRAEQVKKGTEDKQNMLVLVKNEIESSLRNALRNAEIVSDIEALAESIMEITEQTNLLALNASIEAARAGEAGKGFAVVANEIRILADQSRSSVTHIQEVTQNVASAVNLLKTDSESLLEFVSKDICESLDGFKGIATHYEQDALFLSDLVNEFSQTSASLLESIDGVLETVSQVSNSAMEGATGTSVIAEHMANVTIRVSGVNDQMTVTEKLSSILLQNVEQFKV